MQKIDINTDLIDAFTDDLDLSLIHISFTNPVKKEEWDWETLFFDYFDSGENHE